MKPTEKLLENMPDRIYLDNGATSWPKPEAVYQAVDAYQRHNGAPAGRSAYSHASESERIVYLARSRVAKLLGAQSPESIVFTSNGTDSLNLALHGTLAPGDHVVTTVVEHNSVLRPLNWLEQHRQIHVTHVPCDSQGFVSPDDIGASIQTKTKLIAVSHVSNVTGAIQAIDAIAKIAADADVLFLVDAAQSLGHLPLDVGSVGIDLVASPGHKGLLGPLGTGVLYLGPGMQDLLRCHRQGGTGSMSENDFQPDVLPDKYESGSHNVPALAGLSAGVDYLLKRTLDDVRQHDRILVRQLIDGLQQVKNVVIHGPQTGPDRLGVVSISITGYSPQEVVTLLDVSGGVQTRGGLHCAPRMHRALGTEAAGGTVRLSLGPLNTPEQIDIALESIAQIARSAP